MRSTRASPRRSRASSRWAGANASASRRATARSSTPSATTSEQRSLEALRKLGGDEVAALCYRLDDHAAALHLFRVAAGLDSLVPGEGEILGQVRAAYEAGAPGLVAQPAVPRRAARGQERARAQTTIAESPASVSSAAAALAQQVFGDLKGRRVLIVGAGKVGELAARSLAARGAEFVAVANRSEERGRGARATRIGAPRADSSGSRRSWRTRTSPSSCTSAPGFLVRPRGRARAQGAAAVPHRPRRAARRRSGRERDRRLLPLRHRRSRGGRRGDASRAGAARRSARRRSSPRRRSGSGRGRRRSTSSRRSPRCARVRRRSAPRSCRRRS